MDRTAVNPWAWSTAFGFSQAIVVEGHQRLLVASGQTSIDGEGAVQHDGDMAGQVAAATANLTTVLAEAGMTMADVVKLTVYTTDVDEYLGRGHALTEALQSVGNVPAMTLLGVARLAYPNLLVEIEAVAIA